MTDRTRQSNRGSRSPASDPATQPGDPGAAVPFLALGELAAPGNYCGWDTGTEYTAADRIRDERAAERDDRLGIRDDCAVRRIDKGK